MQREAAVPSHIRIIRAQEFIVATPEGQLDLERSKSLLMEIGSAGASLTDYEILLDTRKTRSAMSVGDLWFLAAELSSIGRAFARRTAVLCPREGFDQAAFFALCAKNRGFQVRAFTSFEDAIEWLIANGS
jgi:hypothetical protein